METFLILMAVALITAVIGFVLIGLTAAKKIHMGGRVSAYILFSLLPFVFWGNSELIGMSIGHFMLSWYLLIPVILIDFNIFLITGFLVIKINIFPITASEKMNQNPLPMRAGERLLKYSIYTNILYFFPVVVYAVYYCIEHPETVKTMLSFLDPLLLLIPMINIVTACVSLYVYSIMFIWFFLLGISFILCMNGTVRILVASKRIRKFAVLYILLMFVPLVNIVCMLVLCRLVKKEIKSMTAVAETVDEPLCQEKADVKY